MTALGLVFALAYIIGLAVGGRVGLLAVAAAAISFNDSAAVVFGPASISPFYMGMLVYLPLVYLKNGFPRPLPSLPLGLAIYAGAITLLGPTLFARLPVVASGLGIDVQANRLSELAYSSSNLAQMIYLVLNLMLLMALSTSEDARRWIPPIPAVVGTLVASLAWWFQNTGREWPDGFFRNNTLNAYAYVKSPRLAAHFSEPSHLAAFALTSAVLLTACVLVQKPRITVSILMLACAAADILLIVESGSATALAGAAIFAIMATLWSGYRLVIRRARVPVGWVLIGLVLLVIIFAGLPEIVAYGREVIDYKLNTRTSIRSRTSADAASWRIFLDTGTFGVGLGSNRSSSLLLLLLSTVGLIGTTLFVLLMGKAVRDGLRDRSRRAWAAGLTALLATSFFSLADLISPMMWLLAGYCWIHQSRIVESAADDRIPVRSAQTAHRSRSGRSNCLETVPHEPEITDEDRGDGTADEEVDVVGYERQSR